MQLLRCLCIRWERCTSECQRNIVTGRKRTLLIAKQSKAPFSLVSRSSRPARGLFTPPKREVATGLQSPCRFLRLCCSIQFQVWQNSWLRRGYQFPWCAIKSRKAFRSLRAFEMEPDFKNSVALVSERTIPTERQPLVGEANANFCGYRVSRGAQRIPWPYSRFSRPEPLLFLPSRDLSRWPRGTLYPQKLALNSSTSGGRSVGIVRLRTKATE
jgi:hypothetical protein